MVAVAHHERPRHLRLVTDNEEVIRRRQRELAILRRRLVAVALVVGLLVALGLALGRAGSARWAGADGVPGADADASGLPIAQIEYVVQPGDTLWKLARALQPEGDVRPLVQELGRARNGAPLRAGERITLP